MAALNKIGIHLMMWQYGLQTPILPLLEKAKQAGFDGVEFSLRSLKSIKEAEVIHQKIAELGLGVTCTYGFPPELDIASADSKMVEGAITQTRLAIEMAAVLGSPILAGILYSAAGFRAESQVECQKRRERAARNLRSVSDYANQQGVTLAVEPVNRYETDMITTTKQGIDFIGMVGNPKLRLLFDVFHASIEEKSVPGAIREAGNYIGHVHFSENFRGIPGAGSLPYPEIMRALKDIHYQGWIVVEVIGVPDGEFAQRFKGAALDVPADEAAKLSAAFIRKLIALP